MRARWSTPWRSPHPARAASPVRIATIRIRSNRSNNAAAGGCGLTSAHRDNLHQIKSLNHGRAAQAGVLSALLAKEGYHGPREVLTVENGFFDAFLGLPEAGHEVATGIGEKYLMRQIAYKRY